MLLKCHFSHTAAQMVKDIDANVEMETFFYAEEN